MSVQSDRFEPDAEEAQEILSDMSDDKGGRRPKVISDATRELSVRGGAFLPDFVGGPITRSVGSKPLNVLLKFDESGSMYEYRELVRRLLKWLRNRFVEYQKMYGVTITLGVIGFNHNVNKFVETDRVENIPEDVFDGYSPGGSTALDDALALGILGDAVLTHKWFIEGANAQSISIAFTDTFENSSQHYDASDVATIVTDLRKTRRRTFGALLTVNPRTESVAVGNMMNRGYLRKNIVTVQNGETLTDSDIVGAFELISSSVAQRSAVMSGKMSAARKAGESPDEAADTLLFS